MTRPVKWSPIPSNAMIVGVFLRVPIVIKDTNKRDLLPCIGENGFVRVFGGVPSVIGILLPKTVGSRVKMLTVHGNIVV